LKIDLAHRPPGYERFATFHPTFLYESLWCLLVFGTLLAVEHRYPLRRGQVFALYVAMYTFGRTWFEALRIDDATRIFGIRFNLLLSACLCVFGAVWFVWLGRHSQPSELHRHDPKVPPEGVPDREDDEDAESSATAQVDDRQA
jgi:prolipoprotein diacylglyceryltransferase